MSGKDLARQFREQGPAPRARSGGGSFGFIIAVIAVCALGFGGVAGYRMLAPQAGMTTVAATKSEDVVWTEADTAKCEARARTAAAEDLPDDLMMANPALTDGAFAAFATRVQCRATLKVARLCDGAEKAAFVSMVNDYTSRLDLVVAALNLQGAPMAIIGQMMGGEAQMGSDMYDLTKEQTIAYLKIYHNRVATALRDLVAANLISLSDFGVFMGIGASGTITKMLDGMTATHTLCT
jgi:hypothetical protein